MMWFRVFRVLGFRVLGFIGLKAPGLIRLDGRWWGD